MERWADLLLRLRVPILVVAVLLTVPATRLALQIQPEETFDDWFWAEDPSYRTFKWFQDVFGNDMFAVVTVTDDDLFSTASLRALAALTDRLEHTPGVAEVTSLTNVEYVQGVGDELVVGPLVETIPETAAARAQVRARALGTDLYRRVLVSDDGRTAGVLVRLAEYDTGSEEQRIVGALQATVARASRELGRPFLLAGFPVLDAEILTASMADARVFLEVSAPVIFGILLLFFRRLVPAVLSFLTVGLALVLTFACYVAAGHRFGMLTAILPVLILAIGIADAVHILVHYYEELSAGRERRAALVETLRRMVRPCLFTSLTTAAGLASFLASDIPTVRLTGLYAAIGVLIAFVLSVTVLPAVLSWLPAPVAVARRGYGEGAFTRTLGRLTRFVLRYRRAILVGAVALAGLSALGAARVTSETTWLRMLRESNPLRAVYATIEARLSGVNNLEFLVRGPEGQLQDPALLRRLDRVEAFIASRPEVSKVVSLTDYVKEINRALSGGDSRAYAIPPTRAAVSQELLLYEVSGGKELADVATSDYATGRMTVWFATTSSREGARLRDAILAFARDQVGLDLVATGSASLWADMELKVLRSQARSLPLAAALITLCMVLLLRSVRLGLVSLIPNVLPIVMMFGTMGLCGIPLDITTVIVAGLALGIAVDDTIHFMTRFQRELAATGSYEQAIRRSNLTIARAMIATSVILGAGFATFTLGSFTGTVYFGVLCGLTMAYALAGDLLLLPALLLVLRPLRVAGADGRG
jgi:predicted RND superfamily exporter protein